MKTDQRLPAGCCQFGPETGPGTTNPGRAGGFFIPQRPDRPTGSCHRRRKPGVKSGCFRFRPPYRQLLSTVSKTKSPLRNAKALAHRSFDWVYGKVTLKGLNQNRAHLKQAASKTVKTPRTMMRETENVDQRDADFPNCITTLVTMRTEQATVSERARRGEHYGE